MAYYTILRKRAYPSMSRHPCHSSLCIGISKPFAWYQGNGTYANQPVKFATRKEANRMLAKLRGEMEGADRWEWYVRRQNGKKRRKI